MKRTVVIASLSILMLGAMCFRHDEFESKKNVLLGIVTDQESHDPLIGVSIRIDSTGAAALTDLDGRYWMRDISPGKHLFSVRHIGYEPKDTTLVITAKSSLRCDLELTALPVDRSKVIR